MSQEAVAAPVREVDPHRLAWGVLLLAFAVFCVICVTVVFGVEYFLFRSNVPIEPVLNLGRGSVALLSQSNATEVVGRNGATIAAGTTISTNPQSQGTVLFFDPQYDDAVATITVTNSSSVTLRNATRPRFEWSRTQHVISLLDVSGELRVDVTESEGRDVLVTIQTPQGNTLNLQSAGQYTINASDIELTAYNHSGQAVLIPANQQQVGHFIPVDSMGSINYETGEFTGARGYVELLSDTDLQRLRSGTPDEALPNWVCSTDPGDSPSGRFEFVLTEGIESLRMVRGDGATSHGRTSCVQSFGQAGLAIESAGFNYLALNATLYIDSQTLQVCGFDGSECPITLRIDYIDAEGEAQNWHHGFYALEAPNFPVRCSGCLHDHEQINAQAWYDYRSPNLLTLFSPDPPPATIVAVWVYASGHEWDVRVSDVSLLAANLDLESEEAPAEES